MTVYFFAIANGRRCRCFIDTLLIDGVRIFDQSLIMNHIVSFYSNLLGSKPDPGLGLCPDFWDEGSKISPGENLGLMVPLSDEEIWQVISSANPNASSGPDGFSIPFFKKFWP